MQLPFFSKNKEQDFYFGLFLKEGEGIGFIFKKSNNGLKILTKEKFTYSNDWDNLTEDIDEVLVRLEDETRIRVKETIFFVYSHLVDEKSRTIKRPYLPKIRELSKNLELRPLGYIECQEAVVGHLENKEQTPLTSVLIELDTTNLDILIYKGGHEAFRKVILRSENLIDDLLSVLHEVKGMILLPSRMILYNSSNLSHLATQIVSHRWETDLFIQTPRVEIFKEEDIFQALMDFFGKQIDEKPVKEEVETKKPEKIMGFVVGGDIKEEVANENINNFQLLTVLKNKIHMPKLKLINFNRGKASIILPLLGFVLILGSLAAAEFWLHKADVNVLFADYQTEKQTDIKSLPVAIATVSAQLSDSQTATGKRDVGDSARGEVTVYSFDDKEKTIDKGTILEVNGLQFIFDEDIKIPPFTENNDVRVPGKTQGKITASAIGPESNLKKDQIFKIADLDQKDFYAKNAGDLTGGTKKEIRTVAQKDLDQLEKTLLKKGEASIKAKGTSLPKGERAIDSLTKYDIAEIKFSKEIGEEATKVEGNGLIEAQYVVFNEEELLNLINKEIKTDIPAGYTVKPENINYEFDKVEETGDTVEATVTIKIKAMRDLDEKEVTEKVKGKNRQAIEKIFSQEYKARGVEMTVKPAIPFLKDWLPLIGNNIVLKISSI